MKIRLINEMSGPWVGREGGIVEKEKFVWDGNGKFANIKRNDFLLISNFQLTLGIDSSKNKGITKIF